MRRLLQDPVSAGMLVIALLGGIVGYVEYRLGAVEDQVRPIVYLDPQQIRETLQRTSGEAPSPRAVAERMQQISTHYAERGYMVLDRQAVLEAPTEAEVDVQP